MNRKRKEPKHELWQLKQMQSLPLDLKIRLTNQRIREWYDYHSGRVWVSFSGGKDSTVLVHLVKKLYKDVPVVYIDTSLEIPEVRSFAYSMNPLVLKPTMNFKTVLTRYGYPLISKEVSLKIAGARKGQRSALRHFNGEKTGQYDYRKWAFLIDSPFLISAECCNKTKKAPSKAYEKETHSYPYVATLAEESALRQTDWLMGGCNSYDNERPVSKPLSFWTEQDVLNFIKLNNLDIASVYGEIVVDVGYSDNITVFDFLDGENCDYIGCKLKTTGCSRTGCAYCCYGIQNEKRPNRFELLDMYSRTELRDFAMRGGAFDEDGYWKPDSRGLGYWFVLKYLNVHGNKNIYIPEFEKYEETYGNELTDMYLSVG